MSSIKLPMESVEPVANAIFNKTRFSGGEAARSLGVNPNTLWSWFTQRGVPVEQALALSDLMVAWSVEILTLSQGLRSAANDRLREERARFDVATVVPPSPPSASESGEVDEPRRPRGRPRKTSIQQPL